MDQINNAKKMESKGLGRNVDFHTLAADNLYETDDEVLRNSK